MIGQNSVNDTKVLTNQIELLIGSTDINKDEIVGFIIQQLWERDSIYIEYSVNSEMERATHRYDICDVSYQYHANIAVSLANEKKVSYCSNT